MNDTSEPTSPALSRGARIAASMADSQTPLIKSCWYVIGWSRDFTRELKSRTVLEHDLVFFRSLDGKPTVLQNRCPHRSMPLSKGCLEGDSVRCGYHGLLFNREGICTEVPSQSAPPPSTARIGAYPCVEVGPLVWVWMGNPESANPRDIPDTSWLSDPEWAFAHGYVHVDANYVGLHENLLDLSHFTYLHPGNIGTPEFASTPFEVSMNKDRVHISRFIADCAVPDIFTKPTGMTSDDRISRVSASEYVTPGINSSYSVLTNLAPKDGAQVKFESRISHLITPESAESTHYFFTFARNFAVDNPEITQYVERQAKLAFSQDVDALVAIRAITQAEQARSFEEINLRSDQAGVTMRRTLKRLAERESTVQHEGA